MCVGVRGLDDWRAGPAEDGRWIALELHLINEHLDPGNQQALQRRACAVGAVREQLEAELEAVGNDALLLADANCDAVHRAPVRHVDGDGHDAFGEPEFVHQCALAVGTRRASSCSTIVTASGIAFATGSLNPMKPSFSGPKVSGSQPTMVTLRG